MGVGVLQMGVGNQAGQNPADHHERHAERDEHTALLGRHAFGEHRGHHRDARSHAEAGDQAEHREEHDVVRERLRQREQAVEYDGDDERLLAAYAVGYDASHSAAEHHAEQAPRGERPHEGARIRVVGPERVSHEQVRRIDDHEVIAVEDHGERQQHEDDPGMRTYADGIDDFRYREFLLVHQYPFRFSPERPAPLRQPEARQPPGAIEIPSFAQQQDRRTRSGKLREPPPLQAMSEASGVRGCPTRTACPTRARRPSKETAAPSLLSDSLENGGGFSPKRA